MSNGSPTLSLAGLERKHRPTVQLDVPVLHIELKHPALQSQSIRSNVVECDERGTMMHTSKRLKQVSIVGVTAVAAWLVGAAASSAQEGVKETEQFVKAGGNLSQAVGAAKLQMQNTMTSYSDLLAKSSTDMKDGYKKLRKNMKEMNDKVDDARERVAKMQETGNAYFAGRAATIKKIQDPSLQAQAQQRLEASQKEFETVLASLRDARDSLDPVRKDLNDQIKYLESDLSPSGTASLKPQAEKTKASASVLFGKADDAIRTANSYFSSLRAR
jgi:chromosome segregation ATPase